MRFIHPSQLFGPDSDPAAVAGAASGAGRGRLAIAGDEDLKWLERYAFAGGHLVVGIRTGYEDHEARARIERKPAFLADAAGVWYEEFSTVDAPITVTGSPGFVSCRPPPGPPDGSTGSTRTARKP